MTTATRNRGPKITTRGKDAAVLISSKTPFHTHGALHAKFMRVGDTLGSLPAEYRPQFAEDWLASGREMYVVFSYTTPIAWFAPSLGHDGAWRIPDAKYSVTTSRHQGKLYRIAPVACKDGYRV